MKKKDENKSLKKLTILLFFFSLFVIKQLFMRIPLYQVEEALCLDKQSLIISTNQLSHNYLAKNHYVYYHGKKLLYELADIEEKNLVMLHIDEPICRTKTISIAIYTEKKSIFTILKDVWRKE